MKKPNLKILSFLILYLAVTFPTLAQIEAKIIDYSNKLEVILEKELSAHSFSDKFYSVSVVDTRDDTTAVGYYYIPKREAQKHAIKPGSAGKNDNIDKWSKVYFCTPTLQQALSVWISEYLQCEKNTSVKNKLLIVVKKFWLSPEADKIKFDNNKRGQTINGWDAGLLCKLEFYLEKDSVFYPLYRTDSIFTYKERLNDFAGMTFVDNSGQFITSALKNSLDNLSDINCDEIIAKKRKLSFTDIHKEYSKKTESPLLKATVYNKGVYKDFDEFKTNSPSIIEFEFRESKLSDIMYVKEGGSEYPARNVWGYCDGTNMFINSGDKYSKLERKENTFYFFGTKGIVQRTKIKFITATALGYATNSSPKKAVYKLDLKYYQIDMETGEVY